MNVFLYAGEEKAGRSNLEAMVGETVKADQLYHSTDLAEMVDRLRSAVHSQDIIMLLLATGEELDKFLAVKSLFDDIRLILILPSNKPELASKGYRLLPRYVDTSPDPGFSKVMAVLSKMLSAPGLTVPVKK